MDKRPNKIDPLLAIGFVIVVVILSIGIFTPRATPDMSPLEIYELGMVKMVSGFLGAIGGIVMMTIAFIKLKRQKICPSCGNNAESIDDVFCRKCGTPFAK